MEKIIEKLYTGNYSCVVENYDEIYTFSQSGIADLCDMIKNKPGFLNDAYVADKVVGKAAAALLVLGRTKKIYAAVISLSALVLLREAGIENDFGRLVPFIQNRNKAGWCPLERMCYEEKSARDILLIIEEFISSTNKNKQLKPLTFNIL